MTAPGNDTLLAVLLVAFTVCTGYAAGRIHQWYRTALERDQAYRDGYDTATRSLFGLAARMVRPRRSDKGEVRGTATVTSILAASAGTGPTDTGRHTRSDDLSDATTYRLSPERVARAARVPQQGGAHGGPSGGQSIAQPGADSAPMDDRTQVVRRLRAS